MYAKFFELLNPPMKTVIENDFGYLIRCPKCGWHKFPKVGKQGATWTFNGDFERPTFKPSMNESVGPMPEGSKHAGKILRCHFVITDGIQNFCHDCTHDMAGKSMPLMPWTQAEAMRHGLTLDGRQTTPLE